FGGEVVNPLVVPTMAGHFVSGLVHGADQMRTVFGDLPDNKKSGLDAMFGQLVQQPAGGRFQALAIVLRQRRCNLQSRGRLNAVMFFHVEAEDEARRLLGDSFSAIPKRGHGQPWSSNTSHAVRFSRAANTRLCQATRDRPAGRSAPHGDWG